MSNELTKEVMETLTPSIKTAVATALKGSLDQRIPELKTALSSDLWDKAVAEIGKQLNLPTEIISSLQSLDDLVKGNIGDISEKLKDMYSKVEAFQDRLKGVDLNETITMKYGALQKLKIKSAVAWGLVCLGLGFLGGLVAGLAF